MMNDRERRYLVSTAEDFYYAGVDNPRTIAMALMTTVDSRGIDLTEADLLEIISEAHLNYVKGKKTKGFFGLY
jgi:hypothetical protein